MSEPIDPPERRPNRTLRTGLIVAAVMAAVVGGIWYLLSRFEAVPPTRSELIGAYESSGMPTAEAECAASAILDNLSDHQVSMIVERGPSGAPVDDPKKDDEPIDRARAALSKCRESVTPTTEAGQGTDDRVPGAPTTAEGSSTTIGDSPTTDGGSFDTVAPSSTPASTSTTTVAG